MKYEMKIDNFDVEFLEREGDNPQDILNETIGLQVGENNAGKYVTGIRHYLNHKLEVEDVRHIGEMEETVVRADGSITTKRMLLLSETEKNNPRKVMELMGFDPVQWELVDVRFRRNYWDVTIKNRLKQGVKHTNHAFMVTMKVKPIQKMISQQELVQIFEELKPPDLEKIEPQVSKDGYMLELPMMDVHVGKLVWGEEVDEDNYDLKIATELYKATVLDLLEKVETAGWNIKRIIFPVGQDFYHIDDSRNETTAGTVVDTDGRWAKIYRQGLKLLVWTIEQLRHIAPVEVFYVAGNHDVMLSYFATLHVGAYYRDIENVQVDTAPTRRKYIRHGKCLIGFAHGKDEGKRIEHIMQTSSPDWSECPYREWHLGHLHHERAKEIGGVTIRRISAITETDGWHYNHGFVGNLRKAQAFLWHEEHGKQFTLDSNVFVEV